MGRKENKSAKCPFYKEEDRQKVFCEGVEENSKIHLAFSSPTQKSEYCRKYCYRNYKYCLIADMLFYKYDEEEENQP